MSNFEQHNIITVNGVEFCTQVHDATTYVKLDDIKEFLNTDVQQLKAKTASVAEDLKGRNTYGADYHKRSIIEIVDKLLQLAAV